MQGHTSVVALQMLTKGELNWTHRLYAALKLYLGQLSSVDGVKCLGSAAPLAAPCYNHKFLEFWNLT